MPRLDASGDPQAGNLKGLAGIANARLAYRAFGEELENRGSGSAPAYSYTAKERDATGLMYNHTFMLDGTYNVALRVTDDDGSPREKSGRVEEWKSGRVEEWTLSPGRRPRVA